MEKKKEKNDKSLLYLEQFLVSARKERKVIIVCKYAKGQKSSKAFFLGTPLPKKRTIYLTKFCPSSIGNYCDMFKHNFLYVFKVKYIPELCMYSFLSEKTSFHGDTKLILEDIKTM